MAVSATVSPGVVLQDGQTVTVSDLNKLGTPTVSIDGAVGTLSLTDGSVTNAKVASAAAIQLDKLQSGSSAQVIVANSSGVPTYVGMSGDATISDAGALTLATDSVVTSNITDASVTTAKISDDAVTADKLSDTAVTAGSYTAADITVDAQGRVTAAASGVSPSLTTITTSGDWTKPSGVTLIQVTVLGGGGGGGDETAASGTGEGGDGGAVSDWIDVSSVTTVTVTVGTGGTGATGGVNNGTDGTSSSFGSYLTGAGGAGGTQGAAGKAANGGVTGSQATAMSQNSMIVNSTFCKGGDKGVNGSSGAVIVRVIG